MEMRIERARTYAGMNNNIHRHNNKKKRPLFLRSIHYANHINIVVYIYRFKAMVSSFYASLAAPPGRFVAVFFSFAIRFHPIFEHRQLQSLICLWALHLDER